MSKTIWVFHHYADPYDGHWTGTYDLYKFLVKKGHRVTVFSSSFSHYTRTENRLKPGENIREQDFRGMKFVFLRTYPYAHNDFNRVRNMLSYGFRAYRAGIARREKPDVIVGSTPHPFCTLAALLVARRKKARFFLELHDLWLQYLLDTGMMKHTSPFAFILKKIDQKCYAGAEKILMLWPKMDEYLASWGVPKEKTVWIPLGVDFESTPVPPPAERKPDGSFTAVCMARFGPASNVQEILEAAKILQDAGNTAIQFKLFGAGPEEMNLKHFVDCNGLTNVAFMGLIPKEKVPAQIAACDVCIGGLPDVDTYNRYGTIPTKMLDYIASNRPTVYITKVGDSLIERSGAGIVVPPKDPRALADALVALARMGLEERRRIAEKGIAYLRANHDLKCLAGKLESLL